MHRVIVDQMPLAGQDLRIEGEEARHAVRVKRLEPGEVIELLDGRGRVGRARVQGAEKSGHKGEWSLISRIESVDLRARVEPLIHVFAPAPKGDRLEEMIDHLSQVGAASWTPLETIRTVREPRQPRLERLARVAAEAAKQCGRAWALEIGEPRGLPEVLAEVDPGGRVVTIVCDAGGAPFGAQLVPPSAAEVRLLLGPEGDWDPRELERARAGGVATASFGPHVMRIAQAATAATAIVLHLTRCRGAKP